MDIQEQIKNYIASQTAQKSNDLQLLHNAIQEINPECKLLFLDGKNEDGKIVSNPNVGYGLQMIHYADGTTKEFYKVGISTNTTGISVYIIGIEDKEFLATTYSKELGKASVTGYCIKFKTLKDINFEVLTAAIKFGLERE
ncbi:DUF1801 domain-containing protein [Flavobacterium sp.]|uniref:DUF1801 domain-containing protein n=1 Tax=Flavobacterium sp. TaxID=239 RepID=UPI00260BDC57|nr:DUF1801 domain-containing protein [Flavobacterium sp.]